jgi:hypothetical protein
VFLVGCVNRDACLYDFDLGGGNCRVFGGGFIRLRCLFRRSLTAENGV